MRKLITASLFMVYCLSLSSQQYLTPAYAVQSDKNFLHYNRKAKKHLKDGQYRWAASNALMGISVAKKSKQADKCLMVAVETIPLAFTTSLKTIEGFNALAEQETGTNKVNHLHEVSRIYKELVEVYDLVQDSPNANNFQNKNIKDYSLELEKTETSLVEMHYENAIKLSSSSHWKNRLGQARALTLATMYQADYKDAQEKLSALKKEGPVKVMATPIRNHTNYNNINMSIYKEMFNECTSKRYQFVKLVKSMTSNPDIKMECELNSVDFYIDDHEPYTTDKTKKVGKNEQIVKAKLTTYGRTAFANLNYTYKIIDIKTGKTIKTSNPIKKIAAFQDTWYRYSGDSRALSKHQRTKTSPETVPSNPKLMASSLMDFKKLVTTSYADFIKPYGH